MKAGLNRREFLLASSAPGALLGAGVSPRVAAAAGKVKKGACIGVLPGTTVAEKFEAAARAGFEGVEPNTINVPEEVRQYRDASEKSGVKVHSIMNSDHWRYSLTDSDPEVVKKCVAGIQTSLRNAHDLGAGTVLLVPGIVTPDVSYAEVYRRSQEQIRKLIPLAAELRVIIAVENVSNRFLLSPLEFARYIDELQSPWVKAYFDIGNVVSSAYPQDWIRSLGGRIVRVHIKRFEPGVDHPKFDAKDRRTQGVDWPAVQKAISDIGYEGWVTAEVRGGDESYIKEVSARLDKILSGQQPV